MFSRNSTGFFKGALLTVAMRWTDRLIGFISTLILARILAPEDFGIIAMASLVVGMTDVLLDLGVNVALIQNKNASLAHFNTAWTVRLIQSSVGAAIILLVSHQAAIYFNDSRLAPVLQCMSFGLILLGLENIGIITFQKEMRFGMDFRFSFLKRIVGFIVTVAFAVYLRSYWALVIGALSGRAFGVLLSYQMHDMRPKFSLEKFKEIFMVSQWMLVNSVGNYLNHNLHNIMVGRRASTAITGGYTLACEISAMPSTEVLAPINRVLFPALVSAKHDLVELKRVFLLAQSAQSLIGIPAGLGLALVAHEAVQLLLGDKWLFVASFVQILALANVVEAITTSSGYLMITLNNLRYAVLITWTKVIIFAALMVTLPIGSDVSNIGWLRVFSMSIGLFLSFWMLIRILQNLTFFDIARSIIRPLIGTGVMTLAIFGLAEVIDTSAIYSPLVNLIMKVTTGLIVYPAVVMAMWWIAKKPDGAETYFLNKIKEALLKYRK